MNQAIFYSWLISDLLINYLVLPCSVLKMQVWLFAISLHENLTRRFKLLAFNLAFKALVILVELNFLGLLA